MLSAGSSSAPTSTFGRLVLSTVRRFAAAIAATALLALGSIALATPAQAADGNFYGTVYGIFSLAFNFITNPFGSFFSGFPGP
ncbi:hypothetical protein AB0L75_27865 [Streptomyces sp. NPDC052101]|uniref:hypothetical protein n=1 Tax=Streptomyces sp. NPDC052101 TaxID=3155763 RepID=UPI00341BB7CC